MDSGEGLLPVPPMNVADLVARAATEHGRRPAVVEASGGQSVTWEQMEDRVAGTAAALLAAGVEPGDRVAVVVPNRVAFGVGCWGALRAGAVVVPVNPAYTPPEVAHLLADSGATTALVTAEQAGNVAAAAEQAGTTPTVLALDAGGLRAPERTRAAPTGSPALAMLCYTSGTTGRPKGARLTHTNLLANLEAFSTLPGLRLTADDVLLGLLPFFHVFGLNVVLNAAARQGACVLAMERFSPGHSLEGMAEHGVTVAYGAPSVFAAWNTVPAASALPDLRAAVSGADALPVSTWERFADRFGLEIMEGYGLTETAPVLASSAAAPSVRPGTVGRPLPGVTLRTVDPEGAEMPPGEVGEIVAAGPNVFDGYHGQPEATAEAHRGGWFHTGDLGSFDDAGYLTIAGRLTHMLIVSGFNVYPREVEEALAAHPGVAEGAVVGVPDPRTGERVHAFVAPKAGWALDPEELIAHCRGRLARYKLPRDITLLASLPRLPTGKLAREALRRRAAG